jgi:hypothetical protein
MKRDIFSRPQRMTHRFGEIEKNDDPLFGPTDTTFDPVLPKSPNELRSGGWDVKRNGQHVLVRQSRSPVCKPNGGYASLNGPKPDIAEGLAAQTPFSTKKRRDHLATDK